ncbi:MAG: helix-turn-helix domain-containing protein [Candidatus Acidiferrales bacterium]
MANLAAISTELLSVNDTFGFWREKCKGLFGDLRSTARCDGRFDASLRYGSLGPLHLCELKATSHSVERTKPYAKRDNNSYLKIVFQVRGSCCFEQHGRDLTLFPGQWSIYDMRCPYRVFVPKSAEQLILLVSDDQLRGISTRDGLMVRALSSARGIGSLIYTLLRTTFDQLPTLSARAECSVSSAVIQLLNYSVLEFLGDDRSLSFGEALYLRARAYIAENIHDPDLDVGQVARALHCSKRYLHMVFAHKETTISELIWKLRLDGCKTDLQNPMMTNRSMTDIAFSWGFCNYEHFSRRFRDKFGLSARELRRDCEATTHLYHGS